MDCRRTYWPTVEWRTSHPEEQGLDASLLALADEYAQTSVPAMHALLIVRHGFIVQERYYQGFGPSSYHSVNSVTKSIVSALVGIALRDGYLVSTRQPLVSLLPESLLQTIDARRRSDSRLADVTLEDLLRMTAGFGSRTTRADAFRETTVVQTALARPLADAPGMIFRYDELSAHLVSAVLTHATGMNTAAFANSALFKPLGIWANSEVDACVKHTFHPYGDWPGAPVMFPWKVDGQGYAIGALGAHLTAREMARLGYLYLNEGFWDGCSIIPSEYVRASVRQQSDGGAPEHTGYGFLWWVRSEQGERAFFAAGYGGQLIYVVPSLDLVVVIATTSEGGPSTHHRTIIPRFILPAVRA